MEIRHRTWLRCDVSVADAVGRLGIEFIARDDCPNDEVSIVFEVSESDKTWFQLVDFLPKEELSRGTYTVFTDDEIHQSEWLCMSGAWFRGYPQPDGDNGYKRITYCDDQMCPKCHMGLVQKAPFRIKGEPGWARHDVFQLNWVCDEFFVKTNVWKEVFQPFGIDKLPVLKNSKGEFCETVVQPKIDCIATSRLRFRGHRFEICQECGRMRYLPFVRGMLPGPESYPNAPAFKTIEVFGSGGQCYRKTIVSQRLFRAIEAYGVKGLKFDPVDTDRT